MFVKFQRKCYLANFPTYRHLLTLAIFGVNITHLPLPVAKNLEWLDLLLLCVPGNSLRVDDTGCDRVVSYLGDPGDDVWVLACVVLRVPAVYVDLSILQNVNLCRHIFSSSFYSVKSTIQCLDYSHI